MLMPYYSPHVSLPHVSVPQLGEVIDAVPKYAVIADIVTGTAVINSA